MKGFRFMVALVLGIGLVDLSLATPLGTYKVHRKHPRKDDETARDVAAFVKPSTTPAAPPPPPPSTPAPTEIGTFIDVTPEEASTVENKLGEKPFVEPTKVPAPLLPAIPAFPPRPEVVAQSHVIEGNASIPAGELPGRPGVFPTEDGPTTVSPEEPKPVNATSEEDSSSEEDDAGDDDDGRKLPTKKRGKSFQIFQDVDKARAGPSKNPPLKYDLIINGFVTDDGQVLVPLDAYHKYFHQSDSKRLPPLYAINKKGDDLSPNAVHSEENLTETRSSEEKSGKNSERETATASAESEETGADESAGEKELSGQESAEKNKLASSVAEGVSSNSVVPSDNTRTPIFPRPPRPPLQALPARLPTNEDDEEDAGRYLDHYPFPHHFPINYEDDFDPIQSEGFDY